MALTDVVHRKLKTDLENQKDFYQTPYACTEALVEGLRELNLTTADQITVFDPCAGEGAITKVLDKHFHSSVIANDLFYDGWDYNEDFLTMENIDVDVIVCNPPYTMKNEFILKSLEMAKLVAIIMPSNVDNYTIMNEKFFSQDFFLGSIRCFPKFFMTDALDKIKFGGMSTYSWCIFSNNADVQKEYKHRFDIRKDIRELM